MPILPSPFSAVPNFMNPGGQSPSPGTGPGIDPRLLAAAMMTQPPGAQTQGPPSAGLGTGTLPGMPGGVPQDPNSQEAPELDLFQKVASLLIDPQTKQLNHALVLLFAGMGLREALEKSGKFTSKPHRSNEELMQSGYDVGIPGQTGLASPQDMVRNTQPPGVPGMGPASMGGVR